MAKSAKKTVTKKKGIKTGLWIKKNSLRDALVNQLKEGTGRKDINIGSVSKVTARSESAIPIEERGGFPLKLTKGGVHPKDWMTAKGVKIIVDFQRATWLPDDWGQGVKQTQPTSHSTGGGGGILTTFVAPDGRSFFHKETSQQYAGRTLTSKDGWNGQIRLAKLQAMQTVQLIQNVAKDKDESLMEGKLDNDATLFKLLSRTERQRLPNKAEFHICIVSARRASKFEGIKDIFTVEMLFKQAGLCPTWYVDHESLKDYKALGLTAVVGGKLTPARNKALADARRLGKVCVQCSDDIMAWEYRDGPNAKKRTDDLMNAAHAAARRIIISPVAAARFIVAKMRGAQDPKPKLGGVYMLGSCARTFCGEAFSKSHFILGDFFVVEPDSVVNFDNNMRLKEDYDFTCSHINKYGSVMRCNRMTLNVKHYSNVGGACTNRDTKGLEEKRNIEILNSKWPGCFRPNPKRRNEVIMRWKNTKEDGDDEEIGEGKSSSVKPLKNGRKTNGSSTNAKKSIAKRKPPTSLTGLPPNAVLMRTDKRALSEYIVARCKKVSGKTVGEVLAGKFKDYLSKDLSYDLMRGYLSLKQSGK